jgi:hypothetical protein
MILTPAEEHMFTAGDLADARRLLVTRVGEHAVADASLCPLMPMRARLQCGPRSGRR